MSVEAQRFSRRDFLALPGTTAAAVLLAGCETQAQESSTTPSSHEQEDVPQMGDIVTAGDKAFLLRSGLLYPVPNLDTYKRNTKFEQYGRKAFSLKAGDLQGYPLGIVPNLPTIIDPFSGGLKNNKRLGGEMNVYFGGFMTDGGDVYDVMKPEKDMFIDLRNGLKSKGWDPILDTIFFTYGEKSETKGVAQYEGKHTARNPRQNIKLALEFFQTLKERFPLCQFNLIGHSLGAVFALEVARLHADAMNNLILINGPVKGIERKDDKENVIRGLKAYTFFKFGFLEQATDYLFEIWENEKYQRELDDFVSSFTKKGRKITDIVDENDLVVPPESCYLEKAAVIKIPRSSEIKTSPVLDIGKLREAGVAHGRPLKLQAVIDKVGEQFGYDLADAA